MNGEQAINYLKNSGFSEEQIQEIVKALEQESINNILDDIYTEIEDKYKDCAIGKLDDGDEMYPCFRGLDTIDGVLDILNKYKGESEG